LHGSAISMSSLGFMAVIRHLKIVGDCFQQKIEKITKAGGKNSSFFPLALFKTSRTSLFSFIRGKPYYSIENLGDLADHVVPPQGIHRLRYNRKRHLYILVCLLVLLARFWKN